MNDTITIAADPGRRGAIAILYGKKLMDVFDVPFIDIGGYQCVDVGQLQYTMHSKDIAITAIIEKPTPLAKNGVTNTFSSGLGFGGLMHVLGSLSTGGVTVVTAQKWKKAMGCTADKATSMREACARFPDHKHLFYGPRGGTLDGRAEAALIGLYGAMYV